MFLLLSRRWQFFLQLLRVFAWFSTVIRSVPHVRINGIFFFCSVFVVEMMPLQSGMISSDFNMPFDFA